MSLQVADREAIALAWEDIERIERRCGLDPSIFIPPVKTHHWPQITTALIAAVFIISAVVWGFLIINLITTLLTLQIIWLLCDGNESTSSGGPR